MPLTTRVTTTYSDMTGRGGVFLTACAPPRVVSTQPRQHRASLRALANLARARQELRLPPAQPMHRHEHELAVERLDDLRSLKRHGVVGQQLVETERRGPRRRLHAVARRVGSLLLRFRLLALEREPHPALHPLPPLPGPPPKSLEDHHPLLGPGA